VNILTSQIKPYYRHIVLQMIISEREHYVLMWPRIVYAWRVSDCITWLM